MRLGTGFSEVRPTLQGPEWTLKSGWVVQDLVQILHNFAQFRRVSRDNYLVNAERKFWSGFSEVGGTTHNIVM